MCIRDRYSSFVPYFEAKAASPTDLLRIRNIHSNGLKRRKKPTCGTHRLPYPNAKQKICLQIDGSDIGLVTVLLEEIRMVEETVEYDSRKLSLQERRYCAAEKEVLAVGWVVGKFRGYLEGKKFQLYTDNSSLQSGTKSKLMCWALLFTYFDFDVCHVMLGLL